MSYTALYRKYRPQTFEEVIGQEPIIRVLKNQILSNQIGHAYLFTGSRGTGKTTTARIFARAINCLDNKNGSPCGKCEICRLPNNIDIIEIDGASSNRVETIREIKEQINYTPANSRYKIYIIDEVHMLSDSSYNALLKTLEEPPANVVFILATTEPHKLPATIISRCMRFDFRLLSVNEIASVINKAYLGAGIKADDDAINLIAQNGQGSVRDALSIADMCAGVQINKDTPLTYTEVLDILGASDYRVIAKLADSILSGDASKALNILNSLFSGGKSASSISRDLIQRLRDIAIAKIAQDAEKLLSLPKDIYEGLKKSAAAADANKITVCIDILSALEQDLRYGTNPKIALENAVIKASNILDDNFNAILSRLNELERKLKELTEKKSNFTQIENNDQEEADFNIQPKSILTLSSQAENEADKEQIDNKNTNIEHSGNLAPKSVQGVEINDDVVINERNLIDKHFYISDELWQESVQIDEGERLHGLLIEQLRLKNEFLLREALAASAVKMVYQNNTLVYYIKGENSYKLLSTEKALEIFSQCIGGVKVVLKKAEIKQSDTDATYKKLKDFAGTKLEIIKESNVFRKIKESKKNE